MTSQMQILRGDCYLQLVLVQEVVIVKPLGTDHVRSNHGLRNNVGTPMKDGRNADLGHAKNPCGHSLYNRWHTHAIPEAWPMAN